MQVALDPVERPDPLQRLRRKRRAQRGVHVEDLAAHMRPAPRLGQGPAGAGSLVQPVEAGNSRRPTSTPQKAARWASGRSP